MKGTTKIKNLGTVNLSGVSVGDGQIEVHVPIDDVSEQLNKVFDECVADYIKKHSNVGSAGELFFDVRVVFYCGCFRYGNKDEAEFSLILIVWQKSDEDTAEFYEDIPITFDAEDARKIKKVIWDGLGETLFNL